MRGSTCRSRITESDRSRPAGRLRRRAVVAAAAVALGSLAAGGGAIAQEPDRPWMDTSLSADQRAALVLETMTTSPSDST